MEEITRFHIRELLKLREPETNKTNFGHAFILAGQTSKMGAAVLASKACLRAGVGLLTTCVPKAERVILQTAIPEAMVAFREEELDFSKVTALGIGPGIGTDGQAHRLMSTILDKTNLPTVVDADALTLLAKDNQLWSKLPVNAVLTPHQGEFDRLFGKHDTQEERLLTAQKMAEKHHCVLVMKGHRTVIVSETESIENTTGNAGLAKGGSGDALTGVICAFLAQGYEPFVAAQLGVFFHGFAADFCLETQSVESMLTSDVIDCLGKAFSKIHGA